LLKPKKNPSGGSISFTTSPWPKGFLGIFTSLSGRGFLIPTFTVS
jgi:hypothetical protein